MSADSLRTYKEKRDFAVSPEPVPKQAAAAGTSSFVVQKHKARRAGLHYDFRLEQDGVLWSWAIPKGPSLDPADKRMAIHVEDHPLDYAGFQGDIPDGQYGAGTVETWDRGTWTPIDDPALGMSKGHLHFTLQGTRLQGRFSLVRAGRQDPRKPEAWFLIKAPDAYAQPGQAADALAAIPLALPHEGRTAMPEGAVRRAMPERQAPQLATVAARAPAQASWLSEIKFDGYRLIAAIESGRARLLTRNGIDWTGRMPALAAAFATLPVTSAMIDGELVSLRADGVSSFPGLQAALKAGRDDTLTFYAFDLLHLDGYDLRPCTLHDRKARLAALPWRGPLRYSDHVEGEAAAMHAQACAAKLEGIICKRADAPYRAGRSTDWLKVKCQGRDEFIVLGWTPPAGRRTGFGALHVGYYDPEGRLHYAGGVGTGFNEADLTAIHARLPPLRAEPDPRMLVSGDPIDNGVTWVRPELVAELESTGWSGAGRLRHAVFLGLREDKLAADVVQPVADPDSPRAPFRIGARKRFQVAVPPVPTPEPPPVRAQAARIVTAKAPGKPKAQIGGVALTHPERPLWPGITKQDLATYWQTIAETALPGIAHRPLSVMRCPDGIGGESFFQKHGGSYLPPQVREAMAAKHPYLAIDDADGLFAMAQMSAIELHAWGAAEADPARPDRLVFDLDPGEGVPFTEVVQAARDLRARLGTLPLESFCRTTGGKGLHVVVPLVPDAGWDAAKSFARAFAEMLAQEQPGRFVAHVKIADRRGKILIDWLRNGAGSTAIASYSPRARPGAGVATPLAWREVTPRLDPAAHTLLTIPKRLARQKADPWPGFADTTQRLSALTPPKPELPKRTARIVTAKKPAR